MTKHADYRLTLIDTSTGRPVDTRICRGVDRLWVENRCASVLPFVALEKGIPVDRLEGKITELVPRPVAGLPPSLIIR